MADTSNPDQQLWYIKAKGAVNRLNPAGDPVIEAKYHAAMEQGRLLEKSLGDANHLLMQRKREVLARINTYLEVVKVGTNAQPKRHVRKILLGANVIHFLNEVNKFQQEIVSLVQALTTNIGMLQSMEQNVLRMAQQALNEVASMLHEICNWGLPDLPAIPNLFSDTIWRWNGFNFFPLAAFQPHVGFDKNFAFSQCVIHIPNINIFRNFPTTVPTYAGLTYGSPALVPPLGGLIPNTGQNISPDQLAQIQTPIYDPDFNPNTDMLGSVPDPSKIQSNWMMPSGTYRGNIVSIVPQTRGNVIQPGDPDYNNPNLAVRQPVLRADLVHYTNLKAVVDSGYDPNLTAEWLFYLDNSRTGRAGTWLPNFQAIYDTWIKPSVDYLNANLIPWNNYTGVLAQGPADLPFLTIGNEANLQTLLWQLSYVEAGILGYTRTKDWDAAAQLGYVDGFTGQDLDYKSTAFDKTVTTTLVLGASTAQFPTTCVFPSAIGAVLNTVVAQATQDIANTPTFKASSPQFRFTFDSFAQATEVDRFSQFWREFNSKLQTLLVQDPFLVAFVVSYPEGLNSAVNPLADPTIYQQIRTDALSRTRTWTPGTPLLDIPLAPITFATNNTPPTNEPGWSGLSLDPTVFLARPDIQAQPIPVQYAMLRLNLSFAALQQNAQAQQDEINLQLANATTALAQTNLGFQVHSGADETIPTGAPTTLNFDVTDFDFTNNVTNPNTFTLQAAGTYAVGGTLNWGGTDTGIFTVTVLATRGGNTTAIFTDSTDSVPAPFSQYITTFYQGEIGDIIQVQVSHNLPGSETILAGSEFSMMQAESDPNAGGFTNDNDNASTKTFTAGANFPAGTVVKINGSGQAIPVDPTVVHFDTSLGLTSIVGTGATATGTTASNHGLTPGRYISIFGTADFDGEYQLVAPTSLNTFTINTTTVATDGAGGQTIEFGNVVFPFTDGIATQAGTTGQSVSVATSYGGIFTPGVSLTPGALLFVGKGGLITSDYASLITGSPNSAVGPVTWVICVGKGLTSTEMLWEPHIPTRFVPTF